MKKYNSIYFLVFYFSLIVFSHSVVITYANDELNNAIYKTSTYILNTVGNNPSIGVVGGDWAVLGLAKSGHNVPNNFFKNYRSNVIRHLRQNNGVLDERRHTEYSRIILALSAAGFDATNIGGFNLTSPLLNYEKTTWQGINGPIFALLALDSTNIENNVLRQLYINNILSRQLQDGGFALIGNNGQVDITAMALQALSPYQNNMQVRVATNRAINFISNAQNNYGSFYSTESTAQVLIAITMLNLDINDSRFVKNDNNVLQALLSFKNSNGSFNHTHYSQSSLMSTEQALQGLVALKNSINRGLTQ